MSTSRPVVLLDVDGVVNAFDTHPPGWKDWRKVSADYCTIRYSRTMVNRLQNLDADLVWLTTWRETANRFLCPLFGWKHLSVAGETPDCVDENFEEIYQYHDGWWKAPIAQRFIERNPRPFVWVDDDLGSVDTSELTWVRDHPFLLVRPTGSYGLQPHAMDHIEQFLQNVREERTT